MTIKFPLQMKKRLNVLYSCLLLGLMVSCEKKNEVLVPLPNDITFNELTLEPYTHVAPDGGFISGGIKFNTIKHTADSFSGFAFSNQNNRSFVWTNSQAARDTNLYSAYTGANRNLTRVFAVANANNNTDTYFTLSSPSVIETVLFTNTTYNYLGMLYGSSSGTILVNPNIPSAPKALWNTYVPDLNRKLNINGDYFKVTATGYNGSTQTGTLDIYLLSRQVDPLNPTASILIGDWTPFDFTPLGEVNKVVFTTSSNYKDDNGEDVIHSYFCIDGIRLKKKN